MYTITAARTATNIALAESHIGKGQASTAQSCLDGAKGLLAEGAFEKATIRAAQSIYYSVGGKHPDYAYVNGKALYA